ncbi:hypothetical protein HH007_13150 [Treponema denticola]|uniref:hypothetical protein n=1 Tax=Treponema denticola TaxID=158 RepID=UPI003D6F01A9
MIITKNNNFRKATKQYNVSALRLKPDTQEGFYIQSQLKSIGFSFRRVGLLTSVTGEFVLNVVAGRRRSRKVEAEIARILGKPSWNDLVIEARLFVSNPAFRPTQKDIDEYKNVLTLKLKEIENRKAKMREELAPMREAVQAIRRGR